MIKRVFRILAIVILIFSMNDAMAKENEGQEGKNSGKKEKSEKMAQSCAPASSQIDLDVNNVRARMLAGGDMWWNLSDARYEIPKVPAGSGEVSKHSLFAGALWIGGIDAGGQLKMAAQTYRQSGNDFWTGPLDDNGTVDEETCSKYDKHWEVHRSEIEEFRAIYEEFGSVDIGNIPNSIREWPARGNPYATGANSEPLNVDVNKSMAPFIDIDGDGVYNPENGDYPDVKGDQAIWWIYNDRGNTHTETGGEAIGLQIKATAFAFNTNDEVNDMTFYSYDITNYSTSIIDSVFFGQWVDPDLGDYQDDFVGCDTSRGLGICYNGEAVDGGAQGYGENPPLIGVDFFQGPLKFQYDADGNIEDTVRLGMSKFLYYNNDFSNIGNPEVASHYYGYLSGTWKDGNPVTFGGNGYNTGAPTDYMFPSDPSDPNGWSECAEGNNPFDRRFVQSSGPFRLEPGAQNEVVVGIVWVRPPNQSGCQADFDALRLADDKAQALYDNNFELIDGPDAPDLSIRELDREVVLSIENYMTEDTEMYSEVDPVIKSIIDGLNDPDVTDSTYEFQGYIIYQLANNQVSASEYRDPSLARPIFQVDIEDGVSKLVNYTQDQTLEALVPELMVDGNDQGIRHTFRVNQDAFASGDQTLVNNRAYYFSIVSYAHNDYLPYEPGNDQSQLQPYLEGRSNIKLYSAVPHPTAPEAGGTILNAGYGSAPEITRLEGVGNGHRTIDITEETESRIVEDYFDPNPVYEKGFGPVDVKVYDPFRVPDAEFVLQLRDTLPRNSKVLNRDAGWFLVNQSNNDTIFSERTIRLQNEQIIPEYGISITIKQVTNPGNEEATNNGFIESTKEFADPQNRWLSGVSDGEGTSHLNWIRSGTSHSPENETIFDDYIHSSTAPGIAGPGKNDPQQVYENVVDGTFGPMALAAGMGRILLPNDDNYTIQPTDLPFAPARNANTLASMLRLDSLASVDLVLTDDKSKWTQCVVVETQADPTLAEGGVEKLEMRDHASLNRDGTYSTDETGRSWFPGYAINVETGKRLNIIFGEDSWLKGENGDDMIWNPTSTFSLSTGPSGNTLLLGGKHYVYIMNTEYDGGEGIIETYESAFTTELGIRDVFSQAIWVTMPMLASGSELKSIDDGLIPTETRVRLRVGKPYADYNIDNTSEGQPRYFFSLGEYVPETQNNDVADSALANIRAVPNPYYGYSDYEGSKLDRRVKITNLPATCIVSIYSTDGVLIRRFTRNNPDNTTSGAPVGSDNLDTSLEWDLRNNNNIPIASGIYLIHVNAPGIGEKTIKWFGAMRPLDFDNF